MINGGAIRGTTPLQRAGHGEHTSARYSVARAVGRLVLLRGRLLAARVVAVDALDQVPSVNERSHGDRRGAAGCAAELWSRRIVNMGRRSPCNELPNGRKTSKAEARDAGQALGRLGNSLSRCPQVFGGPGALPQALDCRSVLVPSRLWRVYAQLRTRCNKFTTGSPILDYLVIDGATAVLSPATRENICISTHGFAGRHRVCTDMVPSKPLSIMHKPTPRSAGATAQCRARPLKREACVPRGK